MNTPTINKLRHALYIPLLFSLAACSSSRQKQVADFVASPTGQAILSGVENTALSAANSAAQQVTATGKVNGKKVALASVSSVSQQLRSLQSTDKAANPAAITAAVKAGSANSTVTKTVAPAVAKAVADATQKGAPADLANEAAARGLDKAEAKH
jgi:hypothetical protein